MIICWDNLEKLRYNKKINKWISLKNRMSYTYVDKCLQCGDPFLAGRGSPGRYCSPRCRGLSTDNNRCEKISQSLKKYFEHNDGPNLGKKLSKETRRRMSESKKGKGQLNAALLKLNKIQKGEKHPSWKGGVLIHGLALYDTYAQGLALYEDVNRDIDDSRLLNVKCAYCNRWTRLSVSDVGNRMSNISGIRTGTHHFYCNNNNDACRIACPTYRTRKYPKGFKSGSSREVSSLIRKMCFERDEYQCQKCGATIKEAQLHCHHIEGATQQPLLSNDLTNVVTFCKKCHIEVHKQPGCGYYELRCEGSI